jgi:bifunctional UDP-N-acetylglucosamine pyrophosphorylase/glucosamine-1-phosphate N-acetyltransferase
MSTTAILLAAGFGTRMKSDLPKTLHRIAGRSMLNHLLASADDAFDRIVVVLGPDMDNVAKAASPHVSVVQHDRLGTAHAALQAEAYFGDGEVAVLYADNPLIKTATLNRLLERRRQGDAGLVLLAMRPTDPAKYGRVITEGGYVQRIVEYADASPEQRDITLCNAGVLCGPAAQIRDWLKRVRNDNAKGEYYLTDLVELANADGVKVAAVEAPFEELRGVNSRAELAEAEAAVQADLRRTAMDNGATLLLPETVYFSWDTSLGRDVTVEPHVVFGTGVTVDDGVQIRAFSHLEQCHVSKAAIIGPYAHLRPGAHIGVAAHIGNFVEIKAARIGDGAKANHLSYIGDATVGPGSNIGAGTITCNYDGFAKHHTEIGAGVFIGSHTTLVAPVSLGDGAFTAAGSVVTKNVPADAMAFGRAKQETLPGLAARFRASRRKSKD